VIEGLWVVQYTGIQGFDSGIVVLTAGKVLGGDNGFTYIGTYTPSDAGLRATVRVHNFNPKIASVVPLPGDYTLDLDLHWVAEGVLQGQGAVVDLHALGIAVKLTKHAAL
jgi:hypothetical protein